MTGTFGGAPTGDVTTLCHCWRVTRADGHVAGYTDHDRPLTVAGTPCSPHTGFTTSEARSALGLGIDTADVEGALSHEGISEQSILDGLYDGASVETFLVDWTDPSRHALLSQATIAEIKRSDGGFVATLESLGRQLDVARGRYIRRGCDAEFGDARCGVNAMQSAYRATCWVIAADGDRLIVSGLAGHGGGWFDGGTIGWSSGARAGQADRIVSQTAGETAWLTLWPRNGPPIEVGDVLVLTAGCDKQFATCKAKFGNAINFRGFPHLPGNDAAYSYVTEDGVFDGGPLVP